MSAVDRAPTLRTERLVLRAFAADDLERVTEFLQDREIAEGVLFIPWPYSMDNAREWLAKHEENVREGKSLVWAVTLGESGELVGAVGVTIETEHERAELGYWVAKACWGKGFATESSRAAIGYAFDELGLTRVFAQHWKCNPQSGRVLEKIGFQYEGELRQHYQRFGCWHDAVCLGLLRSEWRRTEHDEGDERKAR